MGMKMDEDENSEAKFRAKYESQIKAQTLDTLPVFLNELANEPHDYGTICLAIAFGAMAAAWAIEKSPSGGITGFQAGCIGWEMLQRWGAPSIGKLGARLLNYDDLLYPQYAHEFNAISAETWERVKKAATDRLAEIGGEGHPSVIAHMQSVADGNLPFGLQLEAA